MSWFSRRKPAQIANPVRGRLQVVACSSFPDVAGEIVLHPECVIDGVITAQRLAPVAVQYIGYDVPKPKWPRPGIVLPVTVDLADPHRFRIDWDEVPTGPEAAESLGESLRARHFDASQPDARGDHAFPRTWREVEHAAASPGLINGLTAQQMEIALLGGGAALGLVPAMATVLSAHEVKPSSAPGGTWDITLRVNLPIGGAGWEAVTRISFSSAQRREMRTRPGVELPVLLDPDNRNRILVDVARL